MHSPWWRDVFDVHTRQSSFCSVTPATENVATLIGSEKVSASVRDCRSNADSTIRGADVSFVKALT